MYLFERDVTIGLGDETIGLKKTGPVNFPLLTRLEIDSKSMQWKLEATSRTIVGMTIRRVLAVRHEMDFLGSSEPSVSDSTITPISPWTAVGNR